jgi:hypothetical protein
MKEKEKHDFSIEMIENNSICFFSFTENNNDDEISKMATDELARLRTNLNSIDNEVNFE